MAAVLAALHLRDPQPDALLALSPQERSAALDYCDREALTLLLRDILPEDVAPRAAKNLRRLRTAEQTYRDLLALPVDFVALKGITQCDLFGIRPQDRAQYDIDLYIPRETVEAARDALHARNYETIAGMEKFPTDHLPGLFPRTAWRWRGDYFDPEMPLAVELHFRFWNPQLQRLPATGVEEFWTRRTHRTIGGVEIPVLYPQDAVAYAALHLLRHLLHGSTRVFHVYEVASLLQNRARDEMFWKEWRSLHAPDLRRLQTVSFLLSEAWFGCDLPAAVREEAAQLPPKTRAWFADFGASPALRPFIPNKKELRLHLSLLHSWKDKAAVARRRLLPTNLPPPSRATETESSRVVYAKWFLSRLKHHILALVRW